MILSKTKGSLFLCIHQTATAVIRHADALPRFNDCRRIRRFIGPYYVKTKRRDIGGKAFRAFATAPLTIRVHKSPVRGFSCVQNILLIDHVRPLSSAHMSDCLVMVLPLHLAAGREPRRSTIHTPDINFRFSKATSYERSQNG